MAEFCDVAVPVPLDAVFTYRISGQQPVAGTRVLVPFREKRIAGIVVEVHDRAPSFEAKPILQLLDSAPVLDCVLLQLGRWIAQYYIAPLGEVFRTMLPLNAEVKRERLIRITDAGLTALHEAANKGSSLRLKQSAEDQTEAMTVLSYLCDRDEVREQTLRSATGANKTLLNALGARKWITRVDVSAARDAKRTVEMAELIADIANIPTTIQSADGKKPRKAPRKLTSQQQALINSVAGSGGRMRVDALRERGITRSTLQTLVKRGVLRLISEAADFHVSSMLPRSPIDESRFHPAQKEALRAIRFASLSGEFSVSLLHGVTGSGKTAVYLAAMRAVLESDKSAIMLVPEIGLTPAAAAQLHNTFGEQVAILHSALTDDERAEQWHRIRRGDARVVVGTRSAVFAPVQDLALLIVDEEHDLSYKQEETPRYHARDVAVMRAKLSNAAVVLGSATPSLESFYNAAKKYRLISMPDRVEQRPLPEVEIVDMKDEFRETGRDQAISRRLTEELKMRLERGEQAIVLLNRRGYSPVVTCRACGETMQCRNCDIPLTHHKESRRMECHYCGYVERVPKNCPKCGSEYVYFLGTGTEKLEESLHGMFPTARIARLDRDTVRGRHDFERVLNSLNAGEIDLLVGTQMIAKGHDIHGVTLVGVVGADASLKFPDFRAAERTFQLLTQVAGRAGRGDAPGKVILQTYSPDHYAVQFAQQHDYLGFYEKEIKFRNWMKYPPFSSVANVLLRSDKAEEVLRYAGVLGEWFKANPPEGVRVLGPAAAPILRLKRDYRYHFVLKSASREQLNHALRAMLAHASQQKIPRTNITVDVDAQHMM